MENMAKISHFRLILRETRPKSRPKMGGGWCSTIVLKLKTLRYLPFFRGPSSAINFECQLLSVEPDHDYEIEKLY